MLCQFHHSKIAFAQRADDLVEAHLQGPSLGPWAGLGHPDVV